MSYYFYKVLDWSEVWALMIPLSVLLFKRQYLPSLRPVVIYLWLGFLVNLGIDVIMAINIYFPNDYLSNNFLYNIHSLVRFGCFFFYFIQLQPTFKKLKIFMAACFLLFLVFNFAFLENFFNYLSFSGNLLSAEAYLLLIYCMLFYLSELKSDEKGLFNTPHFWIVTGLSIYLVINFFVFLFYLPMINVNSTLAVNIWNVHNIAFIIFCLFVTRAFYGPIRYKYSV